MTDEISRTCPVCGTGEYQDFLQKSNLRLVSCPQCRMVYANRVPTQLALGEYYDQAGHDYYLSPAKLESDYSPVRFVRELRLFRKHCQAGAVLDVGCSSGAFLWQLSQRFPACYAVTGTDVSGPPLDYAQSRGTRVIRGDFLGYDFQRDRFDAVTFWAVLEHLMQPASFLKKAASILKPDGLCFVLVPNLRSMAVRLLQERYRYIYSQHLNYFTQQTLTRLVEPWFSVTDCRYLHFNPVVIWQDWRHRGRDVGNKERADLLKRTTRLKQNPLLAPARLVYGMTEKILGATGLADNLALVLKAK